MLRVSRCFQVNGIAQFIQCIQLGGVNTRLASCWHCVLRRYSRIFQTLAFFSNRKKAFTGHSSYQVYCLERFPFSVQVGRPSHCHHLSWWLHAVMGCHFRPTPHLDPQSRQWHRVVLDLWWVIIWSSSLGYCCRETSWAELDGDGPTEYLDYMWIINWLALWLV